MLTSAAKNAPSIGAVFLTFTTISSLERAVLLKIPTRIAPRSRRCLVSALVSIPAIPTTLDLIKASSNDPLLRQLLSTGDGFLTTNPDTQILSDSLSSKLNPVFPICGAVMTTICL